VAGGNEYGDYLEIPDIVLWEGEYYTVTGISPNAFYGGYMTSVTLPESLISIGNNAFAYCEMLTSLNVPVNVVSIGSGAFEGLTNLTTLYWNARECWYSGFNYSNIGYGKPEYYYYGDDSYFDDIYNEVKTNLTELIIGNEVKILPAGIAANSQITSVNLPQSLETIGEDAFYNCFYLTSITIPVNVTSIGEHAFCNCGGLNSLTWNARECYDYGGLYFRSEFMPVTGLADMIPDGFSPLTEITIGDQVEVLPPDFGRHSNITSIYLPPSLKKIGAYAFFRCEDLAGAIILGDAVTQVDYSAFAGCSSVTGLTVGKNVTTIGSGAFGSAYEYENYYGGYSSAAPVITSLVWKARQCNSFGSLSFNRITTLVLGDEVEVLPSRFGSNMNSLTSLTMPNSIREIGSSAFGSCTNLTELTMSTSLTKIGSSAFSGCDKLTSLYFPASVTVIGSSAFNSCDSLQSIVVAADNSVYDSRDNCNAVIRTADNAIILTCRNTTIPNSITKIADYAFYQNYNLTSMEIPSSVTEIGRYAFAYCNNLESITVPDGIHTIGENAFMSCSKLAAFDMPDSLLAIKSNTFSDCVSLASISIPAKVTSIQRNAFSNCRNLAAIEVSSDNAVYDSRNNCNAIIKSESDVLFLGCKNSVIPESVKAIGNSAFDNCDGLKSVTLPNSVTDIGEFAFSNCDSLQTVDLGNSLKAIRYNAFSHCRALTSVVIPNSVDTIAGYAFTGCSKLTTVKFGTSVKCIGNFAFGDCGLTSVALPNSVKRIASYAFNDCYNLETLSLGTSVTYIGESAFSWCRKLRNVTIPNSVDTIGYAAFEYCDSIRNITVGQSVKFIGDDAFYGCRKVEKVVSLATTPPVINYYTFYNCYSAPLHVPAAAVESYSAANYWKQFTSIVAIPGCGPGDVNGDGETSVKDLTQLITLLMNGGELPIFADVDGDGEVSIKDVTALIANLMNNN